MSILMGIEPRQPRAPHFCRETSCLALMPYLVASFDPLPRTRARKRKTSVPLSSFNRCLIFASLSFAHLRKLAGTTRLEQLHLGLCP